GPGARCAPPCASRAKASRRRRGRCEGRGLRPRRGERALGGARLGAARRGIDRRRRRGRPRRPAGRRLRRLGRRRTAGRGVYVARSYAAETPCSTATSEGTVAAARSGSFTGVQFHPEKGGAAGARFLESLCRSLVWSRASTFVRPL